MKLTIFASLAGLAIAAAASSPAIDEQETLVYSVPPKSYQGQSAMEFWSELTDEASFMQEQIKLGRTIEQCREDCNTAKEKGRDINRGRCQQNCDNMNPNDRSRPGSCSDCYTNYGEGSRRRRCLKACDAGNVQRCDEASTCDQCRSYCSGSERSSCLSDLGCNRNPDRRPGRRCDGQREPRCRGSREVVCCPNDPRNGRSFSYQCLRSSEPCPRFALA